MREEMKVRKIGILIEFSSGIRKVKTEKVQAEVTNSESRAEPVIMAKKKAREV